MNYKRIISLLDEQLRFFKEQNRQLVEQNNQLLAQNKRMSEQLSAQSNNVFLLTHQVETLTEALQSLEKAFSAKGSSMQKMQKTNQALSKLITKKSEKIIPVPSTDEPVGNRKKEAPSPKERGNNNARRKEYFDLEIQEHDIYPSCPGFQPEFGEFLKIVDSIRYEYIPPRFIKHINHQYYYRYLGNIISGSLPATPLLNSNYDASFIAGILQLRYIYSMPVERIIKLFAENGFEMNKSTAHGLIRKAAQLIDILQDVLRDAVHEDDYLHMDETYYTILEKGTQSKTGKNSCKGYIWAAMASHLRLVHFFYENGSRARKVLTQYLKPDYRGAVQCDGLGDYKILETEEYPNAIRLACFQHCKRKFLDIKQNKDAQKIIEIINRLYRKEHEMPPEYPPEQALEYRKKYAVPILSELKDELLQIQAKKTTLPKSNLSKAVNYTLNEYPALCNYILKPEYELDNNEIERLNRYISLSRKNSLFCGSHQGAKRAALIYSLACSCRLNGINTFEYFKDILNRFIEIKPNTDKKVLRELLPDRWKK